MPATPTTKTRLALLAGPICPIDNCNKKLAHRSNDGKVVTIGHVAHIKGEKPNSARYDSKMNDEERNDFSNLIFICPTCHEMIDKQVDQYTVEVLQDIKARGVGKYFDQLAINSQLVGYSELSKAANAISLAPSSNVEFNFLMLDISKKIAKNNLGDTSKNLIQMGMIRMAQIAEFVTKMNETDPKFIVNLIHGFKAQYLSLSKDYQGDDLYLEMVKFAEHDAEDAIVKAAGQSLLVFLFEKCEVFEK